MKRGFTIHWNGPPAQCVGQPHRRCVAFFDAVKRYHGQKFGSKWAATSLYSFGICPHGMRFTGCGWNMHQAANGRDQVGADDGRDSEWYTVIVFLGEGEKPTPEMVEGVRALIDDGRLSRRCGPRVLPHNAFKRKTCPGPEFTELARAWDGAPLYAATPSTEQENTDMWGTDIIASYGEAGYTLDATTDKGRQHWKDVRYWTHVVYNKPANERDAAVQWIRGLLGL